MKFSTFFAVAALATGVFVSQNASAATSYTDTYSNQVVTSTSYSPVTILGTHGNVSGFKGYNFSESGKLEANTAVTFSYTATNVDAGSYFEFVTGTLNGATKSISLDSDSTSAADGALPLIVNATFGNNGVLSGSITIQNLTAAAVDFGAYFKSVILGENSQILVTAVTTSTPLPGALILFGSALTGLGGLSKFRKASRRS